MASKSVKKQTPFPHRLGRAPVKHDARTFKMARFLNKKKLPAIMASLDYSSKVPTWPMFANDKYGDCTIAAMAHMEQLFARLMGKTFSFKESTVVDTYFKLSPKDQGCNMLDVLNFWRKFGLSRHKAFAFMSIDPKDTDHLKLALQLFGGVYVGFNLPLSAQDQVGKIWDVTSTTLRGKAKPGSWGGHAVNIVGFDKDGVTIITWGKKQKVSWAFVRAYMDEAYAVLSLDWKDAPQSSGIDYAALQTELSALAH
jgi:hypothetical protein